MPPRAGVRAELRWNHDAVLKTLLESYCLEPRFECWEVLARVSRKRQVPAAELSAKYGTWLTAAFLLLLLAAASGDDFLSDFCHACNSDQSDSCHA